MNQSSITSTVARSSIKHCIGSLKGSFRSLYELIITINYEDDIAKVSLWVAVCCILHNMLIAQGYIDEEWILPRESISKEVPVVRNDTPEFDENGDNERAFREVTDGSSKRKVPTKKNERRSVF